MRYLLCLFLFFAQPVFADYEQVVKPAKIQEILSFAQFQLRQKLSSFYKTGYRQTLRANGVVGFKSYEISCRNSASMNGEIEMAVVQTPITLGPKGMQIRESLMLKACGNQLEIFSLERHAKNLQPTPEIDLIKGVLPEYKTSDFYRLNLNGEKIKIEVSNENNLERLSINFPGTSGNSELQFQITDTLQVGLLKSQFFKLYYVLGSRVLQNHEVEYIWNLEPKTQVPRQYLYYQQKEILPAEFLLLVDSLYNKTLYALILSNLSFEAILL